MIIWKIKKNFALCHSLYLEGDYLITIDRYDCLAEMLPLEKIGWFIDRKIKKSIITIKKDELFKFLQINNIRNIRR